jgi:integrase
LVTLDVVAVAQRRTRPKLLGHNLHGGAGAAILGGPTPLLEPATVVKAYQLLGRTMTAAVNADMVPRSPCRAVRLPKVEREEMRFLNPAEVATLADVIDTRYRALVLVAAYGGLRMGELAGLRRRRVDLLRGTVDVAEIVVEVRGELYMGQPKTRAGRRIVTLPRSVAEELAEHLEPVGDADGWVFTADKGGVLRPSNFRVKVELPGGPSRPQRGPRRSKQEQRPAVVAGLTWADWGAPPGTRTPNRCLKRALLCQLS